MRSQTTEIVYEFVRHFCEKHGYPPTIRDIADGCFINVATVIRHLDKLEAQGRLAREPGKARGLTLHKDP